MTAEAETTTEGATREFSADAKKLGDTIVALTLLQAKELSDYLKEVHGIEPATGGAVMVAGPAAGGADEDEGPSTVDVHLVSAGGSKIQVIKAVREITGLGLKEAKALVDAAPTAIKEKLDTEEANRIKTQLEEAGATVEFK